MRLETSAKAFKKDDQQLIERTSLFLSLLLSLTENDKHTHTLHTLTNTHTHKHTRTTHPTLRDRKFEKLKFNQHFGNKFWLEQ